MIDLGLAVTRSILEREAAACGLSIFFYRPGPGRTKVRIFRASDGATDFHCGRSLIQISGLTSAAMFIAGYQQAKEDIR